MTVNTKGTLKSYVVQSFETGSVSARWVDVRDYALGLLQVIHYSRKDEAIKTAKRLAQYNPCVRVVQRASHRHHMDEGFTVAIVWEHIDGKVKA